MVEGFFNPTGLAPEYKFIPRGSSAAAAAFVSTVPHALLVGGYPFTPSYWVYYIHFDYDIALLANLCRMLRFGPDKKNLKANGVSKQKRCFGGGRRVTMPMAGPSGTYHTQVGLATTIVAWRTRFFSTNESES